MEELKQPKQVFSRLGWCYIAGTVMVYVLQMVLGGIIGKYRPELLESMSFSLILSGITVYACAMPLIVLLTQGMQKNVIERHKMKWWQFVLGLIMCYSLIYVSNFVGTMITMIVGALKGGSVQNNLLEYVTGGNMLLNFVLMVLVAPVVEEYVFRKVIVDRTVRYGQGIAIVASGLMFGLFHGNLNQFAYAVVLGMFFAFLYVKTGDLRITIAMHAIINFMGSVVSGNLLKLLKYDELVAIDATDADAMMAAIMENIGAWMLFGLYGLVLLVVVITGIVLFIVFFKKFRLEPEQMQIPKGKSFQVLIVNPGMLTFCAIYIVLIVLQLLA